MQPPIVETRQLRLRPFCAADAPALHRILTQEEMLRYFPSPSGPSLDKVETFVRHQIEQWDTVGYAWWAVELRATGQLAGWNGLQFLPETGETEIGYLVDRALWGRGLATEGARAGLEFGFRDVGLSRIIALAHPENRASRRVMEKLGMRLDGLAEYFGMSMVRYTMGASDLARAATRGTPLLTKGP